MPNNTEAASLLPQICNLQNEPEPAQDRFRFTPVKRASNALPRIWDRKPSTSYLARQSRPRKVWKRFRTSFNSMKALQQMIAADKQIEEDELVMEINASRNAGLLRGVKRRCLEAEAVDNKGDDAVIRGRSFLETKWESEMGWRRRKIAVSADPMTVDGSQLDRDHHETGQRSSTSDIEGDVRDSADKDESVDVELDTPIAFAQNAAYPETLHGTSSCLRAEKDESESNIEPHCDLNFTSTTVEEKVVDESTGASMTDQKQEPSDKDTAPVQEIVSAEQESTLVRSALRSSLDGEDAELLNNFLSKAKAKRDAKAAMADAEEEKVVQEEEVVPDIPTPRSRRALEELDANSPTPSPQKAQVLAPRKAEGPPPSPLHKDIANQDENGQEQPSSPATRRSARVRVPPRTTAIPAIRNTLSLRRAKGNEFVFLQRTEAQELALATRKNTRQNKGTSVLPKYALKALARKSESDEASPSPKTGDAKKRVCWNDARLVEFEDGGEPQPASGRDESSDESSPSDRRAQSAKKGSDKRKTATGTSRSTRSQRVQKNDKGTSSTGTSAASTTASATATPPPARRVRRLGNNSTTAAKPEPVSSPSSSSSSSSSKGTGTPTGRRRKLTPKSPSTTLFESPASKKNIASTTTATSTSKSSTPGGSSTSSGTKSKSIFKANAGSTPMPKRVRSRA